LHHIFAQVPCQKHNRSLTLGVEAERGPLGLDATMPTKTRHIGQRIVWALACVCLAMPALAEPLSVPPPAEPPTAEQIADELRGPLADSTLSAEDEAVIQNALTFDPVQLGLDRPTTQFRPRGSDPSKGLDISRTDRPNGGSTVALKQPLPIEWDSKVGADLALAPEQPSTNPFTNPMKITKEDGNTGAAWASVSMPQFATVDARVDPANETGRLGTKFKRSLPVGKSFTVTVESGYSVTESYGTPQAAIPDVPLMAAPASQPGAPVPHVFGNESVAKFDILPSGTTLAAGLSATSTDPVMHNSLSAEQKLYGPLRITTALNDIGQPSESRSIRARFKLNW
jgi:hypothetical protein